MGGATGIGLGIGRALVREGCRVALAGRTASTLAAANASTAGGAPFTIRICDAASEGQVRETVAGVESDLGPIDILVYSAGINSPQRMFADATPANFREIMEVNTTGAFNCFHAVLPGMRERKSGLIVNVISIAGLRALLFAGAPYCASKHAQAALGSFARHECLPDGVRVTNIYPGETDTPIMDKRPVPPPPERRAQMLQPEDVAEMVVAIARLPARAVVPEIVITPSYQIFP
jgi:NAD(P)-dependent dehydrogenase (short-subunit alcohol dehydrogenase family)